MPAWFSPRYMAFWICIYLVWLLSELWMPELKEHRTLVTVLAVITAGGLLTWSR